MKEITNKDIYNQVTFIGITLAVLILFWTLMVSYVESKQLDRIEQKCIVQQP